MDIHRLEVFCKVVELKSFTKAAEASFLSQPTVSEHIRSLEEMLGERLVDRLGREALPTQAGQILYKYAKKIIRLRQETMQAMASYRGEMAGHLSLGASTIPGAYVLPQRIGAFKRLHPAIQITLSIGNSRTVADGVLAGDTEFGVVGARWSDPALEWLEILDDELVLAVYPTHPFAKEKAVEPARLLNEPMIIRERDSGTRRVVTQLLEKHLDLGPVADRGRDGQHGGGPPGHQGRGRHRHPLPPSRGRGDRTRFPGGGSLRQYPSLSTVLSDHPEKPALLPHLRHLSRFFAASACLIGMHRHL